MPTYDYACEKCGQTFEAVQSMRDEPYRVCPKELCRQKKWGRGKVKRLLGTGAGIIFKGSGFYSTDYRGPAYAEAAKKDAPAATTASGGDAKTDKKKAAARHPPPHPRSPRKRKQKKKPPNEPASMS